MALSTVESVKTFLGITSITEDAKLSNMLDYATSVITEYLGRSLEQATYTEYYSGQGTKWLILRQRPVISITSINVDDSAYYSQYPGSFASSTLLTAGTDYALVYDSMLGGVQVSRQGVVVRTTSVWPELPRAVYPRALAFEPGPSLGNIKVVYVAGYSAATLPKDLELAVNLMVSQLRRTAKFGGQSPQSESLGNYSYSLFAPPGSGIPSEVGTIRQILTRYREVAL